MALGRLLQGFADFRLGYYRDHLDLFARLASEGQSPKILIIGCSDARVDPGILTQTRPGDIFTVRNVAALVPPAQLPPDQRHHGTSAAIEFAVRGLEVEHVVVLGHALCGGMAALVDGSTGAFAKFDYLSTWTSIAREVRDDVVRALAGKPREQVLRAVEQAAVVNSLRNLMGFPGSPNESRPARWCCTPGGSTWSKASFTPSSPIRPASSRCWASSLRRPSSGRHRSRQSRPTDWSRHSPTSRLHSRKDP